MSVSTDAPLSDESILDFTQRLRKRVVSKLTNDGESLPNDPKEVITLNTVLDSMDRTALGSIRSKREAQIDDMSKQAAALVHEVLKKAGNVDLFAVAVTTPRAVPEIPDDMAEPTIVPGELDVGLQTMTADSFMADFEAKKAARSDQLPED